jgi:flavin reductase (DIM6/NTAB) family NADH-FMN oxidoreductase RutF
LWPTGVTVITARHEGDLAGLVCNSFTSVSLTPPLVSWCVDKRSSRLDVWLRARAFAVHILSAEQTALVSRFSRKGGDKFDSLEWVEGVSGAPLLPGCAVRLECRTWRQYDGGDHVILVGQVLDMVQADGPVMSFHRGQIGRAPW